MCDPLSLIGGAASIAGAAMNAQAQAAYVDAQNRANREAYEISKRAREAELARQAQYEADALAAWDKTAEALGADKHDEARAEAEQAFMQTFDQQPSAIPEGHLLSGQQYASDEIKNEIARRANKEAAESRKRIQALAALTAYGNADQTRGTTLNENADFLSTLNGLRRGSLGVSQQEQNISPAMVSPGSTIFGDVLSGVGGIVSSYGGGPRVKPIQTAPLSTVGLY